MLPHISLKSTLEKNYENFFKELKHFKGEIRTDYASRLAVATDNSIYQVIPEAVIFPRDTQDVVTLMQLANQKKYHDIKFCARGGGTSTNGQSLGRGIIIDCSKYMREILEINMQEKWVRVQPGVVLDQLNTHLRAFGVSFAPEISPSNRATLGGMINTDACGIGSRLLGRTSDHLVDLTCVLANGRQLQTSEISSSETLYQDLLQLLTPHEKLIDEKFQSTPRTLNGYNLKKTYQNPEKLNLNYLIAGSEGTLGIVTECKLRLTPLPNHKMVIVVSYQNFSDALSAADLINQFHPLAIEAIDEKLIDLVRQDNFYFYIKNFITEKTGAINLVEFIANEEDVLIKKTTEFCAILANSKDQPHGALDYYIAKTPQEEKYLWELRKKSVGLISKKTDGKRRPIPFVEDTAVPPEKLADYIAEFKNLLDEYHLQYGMYGHLDAGCVHVRPALDMQIANDERIMRELSEKVVKLLEKYGGILWGEHGQGHRTEFAKSFFGETLYQVVRAIKTLFDPYNQLNPGKIAVALNTEQELVKLSGPLRGMFDKEIPAETQQIFANSMICNGNGACFNYATTDLMCPSYKITKDRIHSPKGRSTLIREWLRQLALRNFNFSEKKSAHFFQKLINQFKKKNDFSGEVFSAMSGCLDCKACKGQCPLNVDVPEVKAKFLSAYYSRYLRPLQDYLIASIETWAPKLQRFPRFFNALTQNFISRFFASLFFGLINPPRFSTLSLKEALIKRKAQFANAVELKQMTQEQKSKSVILVQDVFTSFYQPEVVLATYDFLTRAGFNVLIAPFFANGKPLQVKGFLAKFTKTAKENHQKLSELAESSVPLVGIDPSVTLTYRDEYVALGLKNLNIQLLQEWLVQVFHQIPTVRLRGRYYLLSHCTEKSLSVTAEKNWEMIFDSLGLELKSLPAGCCGMAGAYGHEKIHQNTSRALFNVDWQKYMTEYEPILATGFSCREQTKRFMQQTLLHPIQVLESLL